KHTSSTISAQLTCIFIVLFLYLVSSLFFIFFFFTDTATTEIYTLSLHDALPIYAQRLGVCAQGLCPAQHVVERLAHLLTQLGNRSEEHTSELQSRRDLVCRLLLEKKKKKNIKKQNNDKKIEVKT